eukprot:574892-Karenia_brevis.AAC.1
MARNEGQEAQVREERLKMKIKRAQISQDRPKTSQDSQILRTISEDSSALWRSVGGSRGLRISRIGRKEEKEEGGTSLLVLIRPCHTVQAQWAVYQRLRQQPATAQGN